MATRAELRRELGLRLGQPFFRRLSGTSAVTASAVGTTATLIDTARLLEADDYWIGDFLYLPASGEEREISDFANVSSTVTWLAPVAAATGATTAYEIWSQFTAHEVNAAIDFALRACWPYFFQTTYNETVPIEEDAGLFYTLPTTNAIRRLCQVFLMVYSSVTGTVTTAGAVTQVIDSAAAFTAADVGKYVAAYGDASTAQGEIRQVTAYVSATELTVAAFSIALPEDAKYRLLDKNDPYPQQIFLQNWETDKAEFPTQLWLGSHPLGYEGYPLRLIYEYEFTALATDAATTTCPAEFIYALATAHLYMLKMSSAPAASLGLWTSLQRSAGQTAQQFAEQNRWRHLPVTIRRHDTNLAGVAVGYPFRP